ncbi:endolytic transglycosylase MltG [Tunturiibacter gelidiferens]|uniref:endolytic transglycosylase MltG n=1 Tax=Tunturiibacter gelidiferens TaxID=3069689 RepID=UPI003D9BA2DE
MDHRRTAPVSLEGYLFPDTYQFSRHATPLQILSAMVRRFHQEAAQLGLINNVPQTVIMASLIEKEVRQDAERPLVAGVFVNRLDKRIPLATDPSVIYAALLDNRWRGTIYASDLQSPSPYNTYKHAGLPPDPSPTPASPPSEPQCVQPAPTTSTSSAMPQDTPASPPPFRSTPSRFSPTVKPKSNSSPEPELPLSQPRFSREV